MDNSVIFVPGEQKRVTIPELTPNTIYNIRVEAYTDDGRFVNVGAITVQTLSKFIYGFFILRNFIVFVFTCFMCTISNKCRKYLVSHICGTTSKAIFVSA